MPSNHLILCRPLLLLPSIFPSIRVFSNESVLHIRWPKYWSFSFSISPSNEHPGLISFRIDCLDFLASPRDSKESSPTPQFKSINSSAKEERYAQGQNTVNGGGAIQTQLCPVRKLMQLTSVWNHHPQENVERMCPT